MNKKPILISVCGGSGSGKTTIAHSLIKNFPKKIKAMVISQDNFYKSFPHLDFETRSQQNFDHPDSFDWNLQEEVLKKILAGDKVVIPTYDYATHLTSKETIIIEPIYDIVIFEGIYTLYEPELNKIFDLKIFVDTPSDERFIRRLQRDIKERERDVHSIIKQWKNTVRPMYKKFIENQKRRADLIVPWYKLNNLALNAIKHALTGLIE